MKKGIANAWVKALRSGKYKQTQSMLRVGRRFCCLGVLCDISGTGKWVHKGAPRENTKGTDIPLAYEAGIMAFQATLPPKVIEWAKMNYALGFIPELGTDLSCLNDTGKTFGEIADIIEKYWKVL